MTMPLLQLGMLLLAGWALFRLWRAATPVERWAQWVVALGFTGRALTGAAMYLVPSAGVRIPGQLYIQDGIWFFAPDAFGYLRAARSAAESGLWAIITYDPSTQSVTYVKALALTMWCFGTVTSVSVLLNGFSFLGMIVIVERWRRAQPAAKTPGAVAIVGMSLSPSLILWSLQPLKDTFFQFLFVVFVAGSVVWMHAWFARRYSPVRAIAAGVLLSACVYTLAGIRWYFAVILWAATALFAVATILRTNRKLSTAVASVVLLLLLRAAVVAGSDPYLPANVLTLMTPWHGNNTQVIRQIANLAVGTRDMFESVRGSTSIQPGKRLVIADPAPQIFASPSPARVVDRPESAVPSAMAAPVPDLRMNRHAARLITGGAILMVPQTVGRALGVFDVSGGRGMLWFTDVDTIFVDAMLILAMVSILARFRSSIRNPLIWLLLAVTILIAGAIAYTISNWGTLFRLREMVYYGLMLIPIAAATTARPERVADDGVGSCATVLTCSER